MAENSHPARGLVATGLTQADAHHLAMVSRTLSRRSLACVAPGTPHILLVSKWKTLLGEITLSWHQVKLCLPSAVTWEVASSQRHRVSGILPVKSQASKYRDGFHRESQGSFASLGKVKEAFLLPGLASYSSLGDLGKESRNQGSMRSPHPRRSSTGPPTPAHPSRVPERPQEVW